MNEKPGRPDGSGKRLEKKRKNGNMPTNAYRNRVVSRNIKYLSPIYPVPAWRDVRFGCAKAARSRVRSPGARFAAHRLIHVRGATNPGEGPVS
jgi:hypothetical protein